MRELGNDNGYLVLSETASDNGVSHMALRRTKLVLACKEAMHKLRCSGLTAIGHGGRCSRRQPAFKKDEIDSTSAVLLHHTSRGINLFFVCHSWANVYVYVFCWAED